MGGMIHLLNEYGYIVILISLMLELIIVPIPNEALLSYVGILSFEGKMNLILTILSAGTGGIIGATISYWIGYKLGVPFFRKYGRHIHMGPEKMERISKWYEKYGKVLLIFSFFVPGIRHIASIISGIISLPFRFFCIFAYTGVFLWVGTFISLGYILGPEWDKYQGEIKKWLVLASLLIGFLVICYFVIKTNKRYITESILLLFQSFFKKYRSFLRIKILVLLFCLVFVSLFTLMVGMVQDFIGNDFAQFNAIVHIIVFTLFNAHWQTLMHGFYLLSSWPVLEGVFLYTIVIIFYNNTDKWLELLFYLLTLAGNTFFAKGIRWLFHFMLNGKNISMDFPNEASMILMAFYGFLFIMLFRHHRNYFFDIIMFIFFIVILLAFSISGIYLHHIQPSDLAGGYVFGAVWTSGMIFSMEMFRFLSMIKSERT